MRLNEQIEELKAYVVYLQDILDMYKKEYKSHRVFFREQNGIKEL